METTAEEIARLRREIGERQFRLQFLVLGDPRVGVSFGPEGLSIRDPAPDASRPAVPTGKIFSYPD